MKVLEFRLRKGGGTYIRRLIFEKSSRINGENLIGGKGRGENKQENQESFEETC